MERGAVTKSQKKKKACVERKVGESFQWKAHGQRSKGDSCSFSHDKLVQGDLYGGQRRKGRASSPAPNSKAKIDEGGEKSQKHQATEGKALQTKGARFRSVTKTVKNPSCKFLTSSRVSKNASLRPDVKTEAKVSSDMLRLMRSPARSRGKVVRKHQLHY